MRIVIHIQCRQVYSALIWLHIFWLDKVCIKVLFLKINKKKFPRYALETAGIGQQVVENSSSSRFDTLFNF